MSSGNGSPVPSAVDALAEAVEGQAQLPVLGEAVGPPLHGPAEEEGPPGGSPAPLVADEDGIQEPQADGPDAVGLVGQGHELLDRAPGWHWELGEDARDDRAEGPVDEGIVRPAAEPARGTALEAALGAGPIQPRP